MTITNQPWFYNGCAQFATIKVWIDIDVEHVVIDINLDPNIDQLTLMVSRMVVSKIENDMGEALDMINVAYSRKIKQLIKDIQENHDEILPTSVDNKTIAVA